MKRAVFLDRDGTVIEEKTFISDPDEVELIPGAPEALKVIKEMGFLIIGVSNQSGVGRGYFGLKEVEAVNRRMAELLSLYGVGLDDLFICPHAPEEDCMCRKPRPGLLLEAAERYEIDLKRSYMIGDREGDVGAIASVGGKGVLVLTGYGQETWRRWRWGHKPDFVARDLLEAVYWIMIREAKEERMAISKELLEILVCPKCKGELVLKDEEGLVCKACRLLYPIEDGIPVMLIDEAKPYEESEDG